MKNKFEARNYSDQMVKLLVNFLPRSLSVGYCNRSKCIGNHFLFFFLKCIILYNSASSKAKSKIHIMKHHFIIMGVMALFLGIQDTFAQSCEATPKEEAGQVVKGKGGSVTSVNAGCTPSACRGAKTKFGEAKAISDLRLSLIALKSKMERHSTINFNPRSYDVHGIVGETDDQSLLIIKNEIEIIEKELIQKLNVQFPDNEFPTNKAKQVAALRAKLSILGKAL